MNLRNKIIGGMAGLVLAGAVLFQAPNALAITCQGFKDTFETSWSCGNFGTGVVGASGSGFRVVNQYISLAGVQAWRRSNIRGGYAYTVGLKANGSVISGCSTIDEVYDLNPTQLTSSACSVAAKLAYQAAY